MGKRGPAPTPTKVLQMRGTFRNDRHGGDEPQPTILAELPKPPAHLDTIAKREWRRAGAQLVELQLLSNADLPALEGYCVAYGRAVGASKHLKKEGSTTYKVPWGVYMPRPEVAIEKSAWMDVRKFAQELGLTPSARTRVRGATPPKADRPADPWERVAGK